MCLCKNRIRFFVLYPESDCSFSDGQNQQGEQCRRRQNTDGGKTAARTENSDSRRGECANSNLQKSKQSRSTARVFAERRERESRRVRRQNTETEKKCEKKVSSWRRVRTSLQMSRLEKQRSPRTGKQAQLEKFARLQTSASGED